jgi:hypothetical protein
MPIAIGWRPGCAVFKMSSARRTPTK